MSSCRAITHAQLPLSACPYKLSITYIHLFLSRYQFEVFHNSYVHLKNLINQQLANCQGAAAATSVGVGVGDAVSQWQGVEVGRVHQGGSAAMVATLLARRAISFDIHIPDQVIVFDPSIEVQENWRNFFLRLLFRFG